MVRLRPMGGAVIKNADPHNDDQLSRQIKLQLRAAWDLERDIPWGLGVDTSKHFLPLDEDALAFPGASPEQELALSQFLGLVVNATISEMEDALPKLKSTGWRQVLDDYPANPELTTLGEIFFDEEAKHARAFGKYLDAFCHATNVDRRDLDALLPKAFGSYFQHSISANAMAGGHAFWWVVASVEEVSMAIYQGIFRNRAAIDPLFFHLHRRHLEEEARHANYAFLMLELVQHRPASWRHLLHRKIDFVMAQIAGGPWVLTELYKFFGVKKLKGVHPFFDTLASCIPLYEKMPKHELVRRMFLGAPYISWLLNPGWRKLHEDVAAGHGAIVPPFPRPDPRPVAVKGRVAS